MSDKVALVTGGSRGLGYETARKLAERGYEVVLTSRTLADGEAAASRIRAALPTVKVRALALDLASFASIRAAVDAFRALGRPLHLLVNNGGIMSSEPKPSFTAEGFELTLGTNHIGPFLLTHLLLPDLIRAAPSRVLVVSSSMHRAKEGPGPGPDFDYANLKGEKSFHPVCAYRNSRLANLWVTAELVRRVGDKGVTFLSTSPGWVPETQADAQKSGFARFLFRSVLPHMPFCRTLKEGSDAIVFAATNPDAPAGTFYEDQKPGILSDDAKDPAKAAEVWQATLGWCGVEAFGGG